MFVELKEVKYFKEKQISTQASIYDGAFLWIYLMAYNFRYKISVIDVELVYI